MERPTLGKDRFEAIKARVAAKRAAREATVNEATITDDTIWIGPFDNGQELIEHAMKHYDSEKK